MIRTTDSIIYDCILFLVMYLISYILLNAINTYESELMGKYMIVFLRQFEAIATRLTSYYSVS